MTIGRPCGTSREGSSASGATSREAMTFDAEARIPIGSIAVASSTIACCAMTRPATPPAATMLHGPRSSGTTAWYWSAAYRLPYASATVSPAKSVMRRESVPSSFC